MAIPSLSDLYFKKSVGRTTGDHRNTDGTVSKNKGELVFFLSRTHVPLTEVLFYA